MLDLVINRSLSQKELQMLLTINALYYDQYPWICQTLRCTCQKTTQRRSSTLSNISKVAWQALWSKRQFHQNHNSYLDKSELLTTLQSLDQNRQAIRDPETLQKIKRRKTFHRSYQRNPFEALRNDPIKQLSNETVDALIKGQSKGTYRGSWTFRNSENQPSARTATHSTSEQAQLKQQQNQEP